MTRTIQWVAGLIFCALSCTVNAQEQDDKGIVDKARVNLKLSNAREQAAISNYRGAISVLREITAEFPNEARANYLMAEYFHQLKNYKQARDYIDLALNSGYEDEPEIYLVAGRIYQSYAELDRAIEFYTRYKVTAKSSDVKKSDVDRRITESQFAKLQMASPRPVKVSMVGEKVNSKYDDYAPALTADGKMLYFTSRRPRNVQGSPIDTRGDFKYYEDIYVATREGDGWGVAKEIPGSINSEKYDAVLGLSPDGGSLYVYQNDGKGGGDIFISNRADNGKWGIPKILPKPINTSYFEGSASVTADGNTMYFVSEREAGYGQGDIWKSVRVNKSDWSEPVNIGPGINTPFDEKFVYIHPDGKTLFFASNGHTGLGSYDIYRSVIIDGELSPPVNLGFPINTVNEESTFALTPDNQMMFIAAERPEGLGERDLYQYDISQAPILDLVLEDKSKGLITGSVVGSDARKIVGATVDIYDEKTNHKVLSLVSDADGKYEAKVPIGATYVFKIIAEGYNSATDRLILRPGVDGKTIMVRNLVLKPAEGAAVPIKESKKNEKTDKDDEEEEEEEEEEED